MRERITSQSDGFARRRRGGRRGGRRGLSLVEAMVGVALFALLSIGLISASITLLRLSENSPYQAFADLALAGLAEEIKAEAKSYSGYSDLGVSTYTDPISVRFGPDDGPGTSITLTMEWMGFGLASGGTATTLDAAASEPLWEPGMWQDAIVVIRSGSGAGQAARVTSNTATALTTTRDIAEDGTAARWIITPSSTSYYEIGGGKTVDITASWTRRGKSYSDSLRTMVIY